MTMATGPFTSWQIDRETMEIVSNFNFLGSKITAYGDRSHEIKGCLLIGRKEQPRQHIKKHRHHFADKSPHSKAMVFWVVSYWSESWIVKNTEWGRSDAFKLWCWRRLLKVPWTARRSNQAIIKEINTEYSLEGLMLKLNLQYFGHLMQRADSLEKTLILGKEEGRRSRWQRTR